MDPMLKSGVLQYCDCREPALIQGPCAPNRTLCSALYHYPLSAPLVIQSGDILGDSLTQLRLLYERKVLGPLAYHTEQHSPETTIKIYTQTLGSTDYHVLIGVEIGKCLVFKAVIDRDTHTCLVGRHWCASSLLHVYYVCTDVCDHGFMGVGRMRILLGLDHIKSALIRDRRQQITPDLHFTCEGFVTR